MTVLAQAAPTFNRGLASTRVRLAHWMARGVAVLRNLGPYAAIEILLPGGTAIALLLWLYRRHQGRKLAREYSTALARDRGDDPRLGRLANSISSTSRWAWPASA